MTLYKAMIHRYGSQYVISRSDFDGKSLVLRFADHSDYNHVLVVSRDINSGMDYMAAKYHYLLDTGNTFMFLMFLDDKPVGFMIYVIMDSSTVFGHALRILSTVRGSGLFHIMTYSAENFIKAMIPSLKRFVTMGRMTKGRNSYLKEKQATELHRFHGVNFETAHNFKINVRNMYKNINTDVLSISSDQVSKIFSNPANIGIFRDGYFRANSPLKLYFASKENMMKVAEMSQIFVSYNSKTTPERISAVSWTNCLPVPIGTAIYVNYYGSELLEIFSAHVLTCLLASIELLAMVKGEIRLMLFFPIEMSAENTIEFIETNKIGCLDSTSGSTAVNNVCSVII